jgi:hypothetical protein
VRRKVDLCNGCAVTEPPFVPAVQLCGAFYQEVVGPLLAGRSHIAALLGSGSDVLGYDTARSTDHGWGPRLLVFLADRALAQEFERSLESRLPEDFRGWPVRFGWDDVQSSHQIQVTTLPDWLTGHLGFDAHAGTSMLDWLLTPQQQLLGVVAGAVYADHTGELIAVQRELAWYPDQVWRWLVACQWHRVAQEEAFVARTAEVGDDTGSTVTAARLVRDLIRLALLLERRYAPYQKWLGTAFARVEHGDGLPESLAAALRARGIAQREESLSRAYRALAERHNRTGLTVAVDPGIRTYHERPARVLMADRFTEATLSTVTDPALSALPLIGGIDQVVDNTDVLSDPVNCRRLAGLYAARP